MKAQTKELVATFEYAGSENDFKVFLVSLALDYMERNNLVAGSRPDIIGSIKGNDILDELKLII